MIFGWFLSFLKEIHESYRQLPANHILVQKLCEEILFDSCVVCRVTLVGKSGGEQEAMLTATPVVGLLARGELAGGLGASCDDGGKGRTALQLQSGALFRHLNTPIVYSYSTTPHTKPTLPLTIARKRQGK